MDLDGMIRFDVTKGRDESSLRSHWREGIKAKFKTNTSEGKAAATTWAGASYLVGFRDSQKPFKNSYKGHVKATFQGRF